MFTLFINKKKKKCQSGKKRCERASPVWMKRYVTAWYLILETILCLTVNCWMRKMIFWTIKVSNKFSYQWKSLWIYMFRSKCTNHFADYTEISSVYQLVLSYHQILGRKESSFIKCTVNLLKEKIRKLLLHLQHFSLISHYGRRKFLLSSLQSYLHFIIFILQLNEL